MSAVVFNYKDPHIRKETGKIYFKYSDIQKLPEWPNGPLLELSDGDLYLLPSPTVLHQEISKFLYGAINPIVKTGNLGKLFYAPLDVVFSEEDTAIPDLFFISISNNEIIKDSHIAGSPDCIFEIVSSNRNRDFVAKKELYEAHQVKEYVIIDPKNKEVTHHILKGKVFETDLLSNKDTLKLKGIKSLTLKVADIFNFE